MSNIVFLGLASLIHRDRRAPGAEWPHHLRTKWWKCFNYYYFPIPMADGVLSWGEFGEEPLCDEEVKMQLSCFMCLPLVIFLREQCLSMSPRPDLIPGGTARDRAVPCSCLSWWPHVPVFSEWRRDVRNAQIASSPEPAACFSWNK